MMIKILSLIAVFLISACATSTSATKEVDKIPPYTLGIGDSVNVVVYGHEDLSGPFTIDPNGKIAIPLVRDIAAAGYTTKELEESIAQSLADGYVVEPRVSVEIENYRNIYVLGEVRTPGQFEYAPNMTLLQAIAMAGGYTYRANESNADITRHVTGAIKTFNVDNKTMLKPGDIVTIGRRWF